MIGVQRNFLRAFDAYLDALFEVSQARADLAVAVGDPALSLGLYDRFAESSSARQKPPLRATKSPALNESVSHTFYRLASIGGYDAVRPIRVVTVGRGRKLIGVSSNILWPSLRRRRF